MSYDIYLFTFQGKMPKKKMKKNKVWKNCVPDFNISEKSQMKKYDINYVPEKCKYYTMTSDHEYLSFDTLKAAVYAAKNWR